MILFGDKFDKYLIKRLKTQEDVGRKVVGRGGLTLDVQKLMNSKSFKRMIKEFYAKRK